MEDLLSFDSLRLLPGTRLDVKYDRYSHLKGVSKFVGYHNQQTIIITTPVDERPLTPKIGDEIIIRFFVNHLNCVCAFRCEILHVSAVPFAHLYVSVPETMEVGEVRKSVRADMTLDCRSTNLNDDKASEHCVIKNLSVDGAKIESQFMLAKEGEDVALEMKLKVLEVEQAVKVKAKVRSVKLERGHVYAYGLEFLEDNFGKKLLIYAYVLSHLKG